MLSQIAKDYERIMREIVNGVGNQSSRVGEDTRKVYERVSRV